MEIPLIPNGNTISVTKKNVYNYIILLSDYKLNQMIERASMYFSNGMSQLVDIETLSMFSQVLVPNLRTNSKCSSAAKAAASQ